MTGWGGGLSEHVVVPEYAVYNLPDNVGLDVAGKTGLTRAIHAGVFRLTDISQL